MKFAVEFKSSRKPNYNCKETVGDKISSHMRILGIIVGIFFMYHFKDFYDHMELCM